MTSNAFLIMLMKLKKLFSEKMNQQTDINPYPPDEEFTRLYLLKELEEQKRFQTYFFFVKF